MAKLKTVEELVEKYYGKKGTETRDAYDKELFREIMQGTLKIEKVGKKWRGVFFLPPMTRNGEHLVENTIWGDSKEDVINNIDQYLS